MGAVWRGRAFLTMLRAFSYVVYSTRFERIVAYDKNRDKNRIGFGLN